MVRLTMLEIGVLIYFYDLDRRDKLVTDLRDRLYIGGVTVVIPQRFTDFGYALGQGIVCDS
jgi:hypothetical protein